MSNGDQYKDGKIMEILQEFINNASIYDVPGINPSTVKVFYRADKRIFRLMPLGSFRIFLQGNIYKLEITDSDLLETALDFQLDDEKSLQSSQYNPGGAVDINVLLDTVNKIQTDTKVTWTQLQNTCLKADAKYMSKIMPKLGDGEAWYWDETAQEFRGIPVAQIFQSLEAIKAAEEAAVKRIQGLPEIFGVIEIAEPWDFKGVTVGDDTARLTDTSNGDLVTGIAIQVDATEDKALIKNGGGILIPDGAVDDDGNPYEVEEWYYQSPTVPGGFTKHIPVGNINKMLFQVIRYQGKLYASLDFYPAVKGDSSRSSEYIKYFNTQALMVADSTLGSEQMVEVFGKYYTIKTSQQQPEDIQLDNGLWATKRYNSIVDNTAAIEKNKQDIGENATAIGENTTAIGENTEDIKTKFDKGEGLVAPNARALEKQIEDMFTTAVNTNGRWVKNTLTGIIEQKGSHRITPAAHASNYVIPLPTNFPAVFDHVVAYISDGPSTITTVTTCPLVSKTLTNFTVQIGFSQGGSYNVEVSFIATGR